MPRPKLICDLALLSVVLFAAPAFADRVVIQYAITGGDFGITQPGMITGGSFALSYKVNVTQGRPNLQSCAATAAIPSYVIEPGSTLLLALDVDFNAQYQYSGSWNTDGRLVAPSTTLTSSCTSSGVAALDGMTSPIWMTGSQTVTCLGPASYCSYTGYTINVPQNFYASLYLDGSGGFSWNKQNGAGNLVGSFTYSTVSGYTYGGRGTASFVGQEISRVFVVPEPNTSLLGTTSLATLGVLAATRRGRRFRHRARRPEAQDG